MGFIGTQHPNLTPQSLDQLVAYFEGSVGHSGHNPQGVAFDDAGARGHFDKLVLRSVFQPIFDSATGRIVSHEALLRVKDADGQDIPPPKAFQIPATPEQIIQFDRLCRTIHAINFAAQADSQSVLFLNISGRHLLNVHEGTHGSFFEKLLSYCGLQPHQVVLEILEARISDIDRLARAVTSYQQRGFRIAIDDFGCQHSNFDRLWQLTPDLVKLDRSLIVQATSNPRARTILPKLVEIIHDLGAKVVCEGIEDAEQHALAINARADLLQGFYYARPAADLRFEPAQF